MNASTNPGVKCNVTSCCHNHQDRCDLECISVCHCDDCHSGEARQESMCASYEWKRGDAR